MSVKIVSGGQTGVDRAALDVALALGLPVCGWVPRERRAEDGPIPLRYPGLRETEESDPSVRTRRNVRDSDATVVLSRGAVRGGSLLAIEEARSLRRPFVHFDLRAIGERGAAEALADWLLRLRPGALNVAGPRASEDADVYPAACRVLRAALARFLAGASGASGRPSA